jgi:hypothetical protein
LEPDTERPEIRDDFAIPDIQQWVRDNRDSLLRDALTILRAYWVAGRPDMGLSVKGSFEAWSALIRNTLVWGGMPDPEAATNRLYDDGDVEVDVRRAIFAGLSALDPDANGMTTPQILESLNQFPDDNEAEEITRLRDILKEQTANRELPDSRKLGEILKKHRGGISGRMKLAGTLGKGGYTRWTVCEPEVESGEPISKTPTENK